MLNILYIDAAVTCVRDLHFVPAILPLGICVSHPHNISSGLIHVSVQFTTKGEKVVTN